MAAAGHPYTSYQSERYLRVSYSHNPYSSAAQPPHWVSEPDGYPYGVTSATPYQPF